MFHIRVSGLGYIHQRWRSNEPRFCADLEKAKGWKTLIGAIAFGDQDLTPRIHVRWEVWQASEGDLIPIIRPRQAVNS